MKYTLLNIGFGSTVDANEIIAIVMPNSAPMRRLRDEAKEDKRLIDATHGRKLRSMIILKNNHIVLSATQTETLSQRYVMLNENEKPA
jgi:extracellular matrix regulatory protein A